MQGLLRSYLPKSNYVLDLLKLQNIRAFVKAL